MKGSIPLDIYTEIMVLRWRFMREDMYNLKYPTIKLQEDMIINELAMKAPLLRSRDKTIIIQRNSVERWERKFNIVTMRVENFWWGWRKRHKRKLLAGLKERNEEGDDSEDELSIF